MSVHDLALHHVEPSIHAERGLPRQSGARTGASTIISGWLSATPANAASISDRRGDSCVNVVIRKASPGNTSANGVHQNIKLAEPLYHRVNCHLARRRLGHVQSEVEQAFTRWRGVRLVTSSYGPDRSVDWRKSQALPLLQVPSPRGSIVSVRHRRHSAFIEKVHLHSTKPVDRKWNSAPTDTGRRESRSGRPFTVVSFGRLTLIAGGPLWSRLERG